MSGLQEPAVAATGDQPTVQGLITDLAARCVTIEPEAIDDAIADSMRQFGEALAIDLAVLCRKSADDESAIVSHSWTKHQQKSLPAPSEVAAIPFIASTSRRVKRVGSSESTTCATLMIVKRSYATGFDRRPLFLWR